MVGSRLGLEEACRFVRGEIVVLSNGVRARLQRPPDFLVIADHAENRGLAPMIADRNPDLLETEFGRKIANLVYEGRYRDAYTLWGQGVAEPIDPLEGQDALTMSVWERLTSVAEAFDKPGSFTALSTSIAMSIIT
jgi:hypothetical protein